VSADAAPARVAIVAVGSELLALGRTDTNSTHIAQTLQQAGLRVLSATIVGDDEGDLRAVIADALARADLVVCTGGLGPTDDDRTRDVVARVVGVPLYEDSDVVAAIRARFGRRGLTMPDINRRQAMVPEGASLVANERGTAPGIWLPAGARAVLLLPGPPREMRPMLEHALTSHVQPRWGRGRVERRHVMLAGRSESWVDERAQPIYGRWQGESPPITTTILASLGTVELHLTCSSTGPAGAADRLDAAVSTLVEAFGADVVSRDGRSLEQTVGDLLTARSWRAAVAESCTGGLVSARLTDVPGASAYLDRAAVSYSNAAKTEMLDVPADVLAAHGAVSEPTAAAMAEGLLRRAGVDVCVAVTGIAGPGGGTEQKPVGLVCFAVAGVRGTLTRAMQFTGDRTMIRALAATTALDLLRRYVAAEAPV